jgi:tetratricopeptide (TPR) repeat protein
MDFEFPRLAVPSDPPALAEWRRQAAAFVCEVLRLQNQEAQARSVQELARIDAWPVTLALLEAARSYASVNPDLASTVARLAVLAAEKIGPETRPAFRTRVLAGACCHLADALRLCKRLPDADRVFARAYNLLARIPDDLEARAAYLSLLARLCRDQGHRGASRRLLDQACALLERRGYPGRHPDLDAFQ